MLPVCSAPWARRLVVRIERGGGYAVDESARCVTVHLQDAPDLADGLLRANVRRADEEDNRVYKSERVAHHELFQLTVVGAAPVRPSQERPSDLDFAPLLAVAE